MAKIPPAAWVAGGAILLAVFLFRHHTASPVGDGTGRPVAPAYTGTGDKTAQQPKAHPPHG